VPAALPLTRNSRCTIPRKTWMPGSSPGMTVERLCPLLPPTPAVPAAVPVPSARPAAGRQPEQKAGGKQSYLMFISVVI